MKKRRWKINLNQKKKEWFRESERVEEEDKETRDCRKIEKERNGIELNDSVRRTLWRFFI
jgi:hypothetical protein